METALIGGVSGGILGIIMGGVVGSVLLLRAIFWIASVVAYWKLFTKAGEAGWKSIIPYYNVYTQYKLTWKPAMFWIGLALTLMASFAGAAAGEDPNLAISLVVALLNLAVTVINCVSMYWLARSFGKGTGYTIGLILLEPLFMILLGFGDAEYIGNASEMY